MFLSSRMFLKYAICYYVSSDVQATQKSSVLGLEMRDDSEDEAYWESIANVMPESKLKLWSALDTALNKYQ